MNEESSNKEPKTKVGAPSKRDRAVIEVSECLGIRLNADILSIEDLQGFPNLRAENSRNQGIMAMVACGFSQSHIAEAFGVAQPTIWEIVNRIDPQKKFKLSKKAKRAFITQMAEGTAMSAIASITYSDLIELGADKRTVVAEKLMKLSADLNQSKHKDTGGSRLAQLIEQIENETVEDAEIVEED